jgi:hypothetical protein
MLSSHRVESENCPREPSGLKVNDNRLALSRPGSRTKRRENSHSVSADAPSVPSRVSPDVAGSGADLQPLGSEGDADEARLWVGSLVPSPRTALSLSQVSCQAPLPGSRAGRLRSAPWGNQRNCTDPCDSSPVSARSDAGRRPLGQADGQWRQSGSRPGHR